MNDTDIGKSQYLERNPSCYQCWPRTEPRHPQWQADNHGMASKLSCYTAVYVWSVFCKPCTFSCPPFSKLSTAFRSKQHLSILCTATIPWAPTLPHKQGISSHALLMQCPQFPVNGNSKMHNLCPRHGATVVTSAVTVVICFGSQFPQYDTFYYTGYCCYRHVFTL